MIRNPVKIGSITAAASTVQDLSIPVGHNGTLCGLYFMPYNGSAAVASTATVNTAVEKINLGVTHRNEGGFNLLRDVSPAFLYFRELYYAKNRGVANAGGIITYDPSAAQRGGEAAANIRNIGTRDLVDMVLRITFGATITNLTRVDVYADIDYNLKADLGVHTRIDCVTAPVTDAGGDVEITNLPRLDSRFAYETIHIQENLVTDLTVGKVSLVINGSNWEFRDVPRTLIERLAAEADRAPQSGFFSMDFAKEDNPLYMLDGGMSEIKLIPNFTAGGSAAGGNVKAWFEYLKRG